MDTNNPLTGNKNKENHDKLEKITSRKENKSIKYFTFLNTICFQFCIINPLKKKFLNIETKLVNKKISIENFLEVSNDLEILKKLTFSEEQFDLFSNYQHLSFKEQLNEFKIEWKEYK